MYLSLTCYTFRFVVLKQIRDLVEVERPDTVSFSDKKTSKLPAVRMYLSKVKEMLDRYSPTLRLKTVNSELGKWSYV